MTFKQRAHDLVAQMTVEEKMSQMRFDSPAIPRLGVPAYVWWNECLHGVARQGTATVFPQAIGMAASFDTELMGQVATAISDEARAKYNEYRRFGYTEIYQGLTYWSPNINIFRDPRWGRGQETYGEVTEEWTDERTVRLTNHSDFACDFTVLRYEYIPHKNLCDFTALHLEAGETKTVTF